MSEIQCPLCKAPDCIHRAIVDCKCNQAGISLGVKLCAAGPWVEGEPEKPQSNKSYLVIEANYESMHLWLWTGKYWLDTRGFHPQDGDVGPILRHAKINVEGGK